MQTNILSTNRPFSWKLFFLLWIMTILGLIAVIPYTLTLQSNLLAKIQLPMPLPVLILIQISFNSIFIGFLVGIGLLLASKSGLGLPYMENRLLGRAKPFDFKRVLIFSVLIGVVSALVLSAFDEWLFLPLMARQGISFPENVIPPAWQGFLASFYGGITEEVLLRFFLLTLFAWLGWHFTRKKYERPTLTILWVSNILAAIIFGLGHLPGVLSMEIPLTFVVITRTLFLNGLAGLAFGWLYWTYGLESAMIAHFSADIILHVLL
ncbi:MAG: CPBP family intramembrane metalloprotease [Actinobacteria bacterium]|nr:CPBP family intramembrane metalloprotease [Actinomycetota bacterium]